MLTTDLDGGGYGGFVEAALEVGGWAGGGLAEEVGGVQLEEFVAVGVGVVVEQGEGLRDGLLAGGLVEVAVWG